MKDAILQAVDEVGGAAYLVTVAQGCRLLSYAKVAAAVAEGYENLRKPEIAAAIAAAPGENRAAPTLGGVVVGERPALATWQGVRSGRCSHLLASKLVENTGAGLSREGWRQARCSETVAAVQRLRWVPGLVVMVTCTTRLLSATVLAYRAGWYNLSAPAPRP